MLLGAAEFLTLQVRKQLLVRLIDQKVDVRSTLTKELLAIRCAWQGVGVKHEETLLTVLASHGDALHRIANVYAGGDGEDEDLYQEILLEAWKALPSFRGDSSLSTWLYRVALNTALTWRRRSARRQNHRVAMTARMEAIGSPSVSSGPQKSEREILRHFLDSLNGASRTILVLYMEGLTHEEIAGVTGLSQSAVGVRIHRMKKMFAERYVERST